MGFNLKTLFSGGISELVKSVDGVLDNLITNKEELAAAQLEVQKLVVSHEEKMTELAQAELDSVLKDVQSSRDSNTRIQESDQASWLSKNTIYLLAGFITLGFFGLLAYMLKYEVPEANKDVMNILLGALGTAWITVVGFFFGSSQGSKTNMGTIRRIAEKQSTS